MKKCSKCKIEKPPEAFVKDRKKKDGLWPWCRECRAIAHKAKAAEVNLKRREDYRANVEENRRKQREYKTANPEKVKEWERKRYEKHGDKRRSQQRDYQTRNREARNEKQRQWWAAKGKEWKKKYREKNRERILEREREYRAKNPDIWAAQSAKAARVREERLGPLRKDFTRKDVRFGLQWWQGCCAVCGAAFGPGVKTHWDHWTPVSNPQCPGTIPSNMLPLCDPCNRQKYSKEAREFVISRVGLDKAGAVLDKIGEFFKTVRQSESVP